MIENLSSWAGTVVSAGLAIAIVTLAPHVYRIFRPTIILYPWNNNREESNRTVVFAASYNPPHHGHLRMLEYLSRKYAKVIAVVGFNPNKKYLVSPEERAQLLREMLAESDSAVPNIEVAVVDGYIWRYAKKVGATIFFRGIRSWDKDGNDERFLQILNTWGPVLYGPLFVPIPTIYIEGDPKYNHVSSTLIRTICSIDNNNSSTTEENKKSKELSLSELVPSHVAGKVAKLYSVNSSQ